MALLVRILLVCSVLSLAIGDCENMLEQDFGLYRSGIKTYSTDDAEQDFPDTKGPYKMIEGGQQGVPLTTVGNSVIKGVFGKGKLGGKETGFTWYSMLPKQSTEMSMSYRLKFSKGFDFTKGGKLPGLCGGEGGKGTHCPVGCSEVSKDRGFSTRLMWREGGRMVTYAYYPDKPKSIRCGEDWKWSKKIQDGVWNHIRIWSKLNTPGKKNGQFKAWLNGSQVLHKKGIRYRYNGDYEISRAYITTYVGGSSRELFASDQDQEIEFDEFKVWEGGCKEPNSGSSSGSSGKSKKSTGGSGGSGGSKGAPKVVHSEYYLYKNEAGWDLPGSGDLGRRTPDRMDSLKDQLTQCAKWCNKASGCTIFTYLNGDCFLKKDVGATPENVGPSESGWRWMYIEQDK